MVEPMLRRDFFKYLGAYVAALALPSCVKNHKEKEVAEKVSKTLEQDVENQEKYTIAFDLFDQRTDTRDELAEIYKKKFVGKLEDGYLKLNSALEKIINKMMVDRRFLSENLEPYYDEVKDPIIESISRNKATKNKATYSLSTWLQGDEYGFYKFSFGIIYSKNERNEETMEGIEDFNICMIKPTEKGVNMKIHFSSDEKEDCYACVIDPIFGIETPYGYHNIEYKPHIDKDYNSFYPGSVLDLSGFREPLFKSLKHQDVIAKRFLRPWLTEDIQGFFSVGKKIK